MEMLKVHCPTAVEKSNRNRTYSKSTTSEFMSIVRLHRAMLTSLLLRDSNEGMKTRIKRMRKLRKQLDNFESEIWLDNIRTGTIRVLAVDTESDPYVVRRYRSIILTMQEMYSPNGLVLELPMPKIIFTRRLALEAPKAIAAICEKNPKRLTAVPEDLPQARGTPERRLWKGLVPWLMLLLIAVAVAVTTPSFGLRRSISRWHEGIEAAETYCEAFDRLKCENGGYPVDEGYGFKCNCFDDYYGERCANRTYSSAVSWYIGQLFDTVNLNLHRSIPHTWWSLLPFTSDLHQTSLVSFYQDRMKRMENGFSSGAGVGDGPMMAITRILPPCCPSHSPADDALPPLDTVYDDIFRRAPEDRVKRDPKRRNMLYHTFYQYFALQFFHEDFDPTVTGSQLYGINESAQRELRSFVGGKLRTERHPNNEQYPPRLSLTEKLSKVFSRMFADEPTHWFDMVAGRVVLAAHVNPLHRRWAVGHPLLNVDRMLFAVNALWVREHNRVCDRLAEESAEWTDERLYGAARRIVVGQMMGIMMNDVLNAGGGWWPLRHDPGVHQDRVVGAAADGCFTAPLEMLLTMMMPSGGVREEFRNDRQNDSTALYGHYSQVLESDMRETVRLMVDQPMGTMSGNNDGAAAEPLTKVLMKLSRENGVQSFNRYREHVGLQAYRSFYELTGDQETADKLKSLYEHVDRVELLAGMLAEKTSDDSVPTSTVMMNSFIVNAIVTNPLYSKTTWKSETFDGDFGFSVVKSANIRTFVCNNLPDGCDSELIVGLHGK